MHAELGQDVLRVRQHVHQMRDRRALVAGDIADAGLQQGLGDRENALAAKLLPGAEPQVLHFARERPLGHAEKLLCGRWKEFEACPVCESTRGKAAHFPFPPTII